MSGFDLSSIVSNDEILIPPDYWKELNSRYSVEEIVSFISDAIEEYQLPMPMAKISYEEALEDYKKLCQLDTTSLWKEGEFFSRYDYSFPYENLILGFNQIGNKSSNYFHQESRWKCDSINSPSPYRNWYIKKFRLTLLTSLWSLKFDHVDSRILRSCITLRKYVASQYKPSAAKAIYEKYVSENVLDFSSGWGDRLSGFCAAETTRSYTGVDPNENLFQGYSEQIKAYNSGKEIRMLQGCSENIDLGNRSFDTIFTSPPYYNIERYTQELSQSFAAYRKLEDWNTHYMGATIENVWKHLEVGGHLIINISDVYSKHRINQICDPMNHQISKMRGAKYLGGFGYEMQKRLNSTALKNRTGTFAEPVWVWRREK